MFVYRVRVVKCCIASHGVSVFSFFSPILNPPSDGSHRLFVVSLHDYCTG